MTPEEKADKEMEVFTWMNKQGYDRRASKEIAPIIVKYLQDVVNKNFIKPDVIKSVCPNCGTGNKNHAQMGNHVHCRECDYEWNWG